MTGEGSGALPYPPFKIHLDAGSPDGLIGALHKLERGIERVPMTAANPATAHMFIFPPGMFGGMSRLFSTHPSMEDRIANLESVR